jgi:hypothetical protein
MVVASVVDPTKLGCTHPFRWLPLGAEGSACDFWSGRVPRPATGDGLGLQHQVVFVRWGGLPEIRLMRGDIDDLLSAA